MAVSTSLTGPKLTNQQAAQTYENQVATSNTLGKEIAPEAQTVISDLNSGNYSGAWSAALSTSPLYNTNYNTQTMDPLLADLESSSGLQALDPSKQWNAQSTAAFYNALGSNPVYQGKTVAGMGGGAESLGQNPYGTWGSGAALTNGTDAKANTAAGSGAPNVEQFAGAAPSSSFLSKYGADIAGLVATVATAGAGAPALAAALAGSAATIGANAAEGKPTTWGSVGSSIGGALLGGAVPALGGALNSATSGALGATASDALAGAGVGALKSAVTGGNVLAGAVTGGAGGAIQGSGIGQTATNTLTDAGLPSSLASGLVKGGIGAATGALGASVSGGNVGNAALTNGASGFASGTVGSLLNNSAIGNIAGSLTKSAVGSSLSNGASSTNGGAPSTSTGLTSLNPVLAGAGGALAGVGLSSLLGGSSGSTTQGSNVGNLDTSLAGAIGSVLPGVAQAATGAIGTQVASNDMVNAENNAITTQQNNLGNINNIWSTQQQLGQGADTALGSALGTNGQPANYSNFENMPGYQFAVDQGTQAIQRQAAAMGNAYTPNTAAAVGQYVTGTASQDYNTYISQLMGAAGLGTTANQGLQTANQTTANNISQLQQNIGQSQAYGATGVANSVGGLFGTNGAGTSLLNALTGSGANNSGAVGSALGNIGGSAASGAINGSSTLLGGDSTNPTGLGGSIAQAPAGNNLQYDSSGNIIGITPNDTINGGVNSSGVPNDIALSNTSSNGYSNTANNGGLFTSSDPLGVNSAGVSNDLSNVYSSNYSNTINNDGTGLFSGGNPFGGSY